MRQMRCRVGNVTITAANFGLELVPGRVVDLDQGLPNGGILADQVQLVWFEPIVPEPRATRRTTASPEITEAPATPAAEEKIDG